MFRWMPDTGGSNIPALNELLHDFGIAFSEHVLEGYYDMGPHGMYYASGTSIIKFPQTEGTIIIERDLHDQGVEVRTFCFFIWTFGTFPSFIVVIAELRKTKDKTILPNTWDATN